MTVSHVAFPWVQRVQQYFTVPHLFLQESCRNPVIPVEFQWNSGGIHRNSSGILQESSHSSGIPVESTGIHRNSAGIPLESSRLRLNTVLNSPYCPNLQNYILLSSFLAIFTFLHLFKSVSHFLNRTLSEWMVELRYIESDYIYIFYYFNIKGRGSGG